MELEAIVGIVKALASTFGWPVAILLTGAGSSGVGVFLVGRKAVEAFQSWVTSREKQIAELFQQVQEANARVVEAATSGAESATNNIKIQEGILNRLGNLETGMGTIQGKLNDIHLDIRGLS